MQNEEIIIKPIITEKSMKDAGEGKFTFAFYIKATKRDIKKAIEEKFNVHVKSVATIITKSRQKMANNRRAKILISAWKKGMVRLAKGEKIDLFDVAGGSK